MNVLVTGWKAIHMQILILPLSIEVPLSYLNSRPPIPNTNVHLHKSQTTVVLKGSQDFIPPFLLLKNQFKFV